MKKFWLEIKILASYEQHVACHFIILRRTRRAGVVARMGTRGLLRKLEGNKQLRRTRCRLEVNITVCIELKILEGIDWNQLA